MTLISLCSGILTFLLCLSHHLITKFNLIVVFFFFVIIISTSIIVIFVNWVRNNSNNNNNNLSMNSGDDEGSRDSWDSLVDQRRRDAVFREVLQSYDQLRTRIGSLTDAKNKILRYLLIRMRAFYYFTDSNRSRVSLNCFI